MSKDTIGVYAFVTSNWKELDYPLDLWIRHNSQLFDEVALVTYGKVKEIPYETNNLIIKEIEPPDKVRYDFYTTGKKKAQDLLNTDWKILLDVDEFLTRTPKVENLNKELTYKLNYIHAYGNIYSIIKCNKEFAYTVPRVHFGERNVVGDGQVDGPYSLRVIGEFYHVNCVRNPLALSIKWKEQIKREMNEKEYKDSKRIKFLINKFDYSRYKEIWPGSFLVQIKRNRIPDIILENEKRFSWCQFKGIPEEGSFADFIRTYYCKFIWNLQKILRKF